jgi:hypothetical protein
LLPVVNIPTANPSICIIASVIINKTGNGSDLIETLHAGLLNLYQELQNTHRNW